MSSFRIPTVFEFPLFLQTAFKFSFLFLQVLKYDLLKEYYDTVPLEEQVQNVVVQNVDLCKILIC